MKYYELRDDINFPSRWYLGAIIEVKNNWQFIYGNKLDEPLLQKELHIEVYHEGNPMDYTTSEGYNVPIVSEKLKNKLSGINGLQFIPVSVQEKKGNFKYFIMVITKKIDCVNEKLSEFEKFVENDPVRPDLAGNYSWFAKLIVDTEKINNQDIFRIEKTGTYLIVSERVKDIMENMKASGVKFTEV